MSPGLPTDAWTPDSWRTRPDAQRLAYADVRALEAAFERLRALPPLVTAWEVDRLREQLAEAEEGRRFVLQGGDCAETVGDAHGLENTLRILLEMSRVLAQGGRRPVVRIGRFAGQFAKPRSSPTETQGGETLPSYFGDLVNRPAFTAEARRPDPSLLIEGYRHAAVVLNHVRALAASGFADAHPSGLRDEGWTEFFSSHEGLHLWYESAQARPGPNGAGVYDLTTHLPWIGDRTRALDGAHVEFFRGVRNPVGLKAGPTLQPAELVALSHRLNPANEAGKLVVITRLGSDRVRELLPSLVEAMRRAARRALWLCDPMHGNTQVTGGGQKTRDFAHVVGEVEATFEVHGAVGSRLGGVHLELTGDDVTECLGGGITEADLDRNYATRCDPRLNDRQSLELAHRIARRL